MVNKRRVIAPTCLKLPEGFQDKYGIQLRRQRLVETIFRQQGFNKGYNEIETPILERSEALSPELFSCWNPNNFIRLELVDVDSDYNILGSESAILRPEGTIPVSRWLATRMTEGENVLPVKLLYSIDCYRNEPVNELTSVKRRQFNQLGVEYMGDESLRADADVIEYAYNVMRTVGIPREDIQIRLSDISLFNELCILSGFDDEQKIKLQDELDEFSKRRAQDNQYSINLPFISELNQELKSKWSSIMDTFGNPSDYAINNCLTNLVTELNQRDVPITVDLSVVRGFSYYTGPVFQIDAVSDDGTLLPEIGGGGRYDKLIGQNLRAFGVDRDVPATGFAFGTERLVNAARLPQGSYNLEMII